MGLVQQCHPKATEFSKRVGGLMMAVSAIFLLSPGPLGTGSSKARACRSCCARESSKPVVVVVVVAVVDIDVVADQVGH